MKLKIKIPSPKKTSKAKPKKTIPNPFDKVLTKSQELPVVVQFFTPWCGACQTLKPTMQKLAKNAKGAWLLYLVDVEKTPKVAQQFNIRNVPDVKMFYKGEAIASFQGSKPEYIIQNWLDSSLPKRKRRTKFSDANDLLKHGNLSGATINILQLLAVDNPDVEVLKVLLALQLVGKNNPQAMTSISQINKKGEFKEIAKSIRDMIDMDVDEKDPHTPTHSPYNPRPTSANEPINIKKLDHKLLENLIEDMVNQVRKTNRASQIKGKKVLAAAAKDHNQYLIKHDVLTHHQNNAKKHTVKERVNSFGGKYRILGENVQYQGLQLTQWGPRVEIQDTYFSLAKLMVENWINSPGHYKNMINPKFKFVGTSIGWNPENKSVFATQVFGA